MRQVARGNPVKRVQPATQSAVIRIHVLHMHGALHADALAQIDSLVADACLSRKSRIGRMAIGHQQYIAVQHRQQVLVQLRLAQRALAGDEVERLAGAVARDQNADLLMGNTTQTRVATPVGCSRDGVSVDSDHPAASKFHAAPI